MGNLKGCNSQKSRKLSFSDNLSCLECFRWKEMNIPCSNENDQIINYFTWNSNHISSRNSALSKYFYESNTKLLSNCLVNFCPYQACFLKKVIYYEMVRVSFYKRKLSSL